MNVKKQMQTTASRSKITQQKSSITSNNGLAMAAAFIMTMLVRSSAFSSSSPAVSPVSIPGPAEFRSVGISGSSKNTPGGTASRLFYRNGDDHDDGKRRQEHTTATELVRKKLVNWWQSVASSSSSDKKGQVLDSQQEEVDRYLEFLDKRYHRFHSETKKKVVANKEEPKKFAILEWLSAGEESVQQQEEDALYALGVAGLASERMLQKHNMVVERKTSNDGDVVIDTVVKPIPRTTPAAIKMVQVSSVLLRGLEQRRQELFRRDLVQLFKSTYRFVLERPMKSILARLERKRTSQMLTATMVAAAICLLRLFAIASWTATAALTTKQPVFA